MSRRQIEAYCKVLAREFWPRKIILIGSYAYGKPTRDSDVDLVVIMSFAGSSAQQVAKIRGRVESPFPMDLILWTPAQVARRLAAGCGFVEQVLSRGKVMHEACDG